VTQSVEFEQHEGQTTKNTQQKRTLNTNKQPSNRLTWYRVATEVHERPRRRHGAYYEIVYSDTRNERMCIVRFICKKVSGTSWLSTDNMLRSVGGLPRQTCTVRHADLTCWEWVGSDRVEAPSTKCFVAHAYVRTGIQYPNKPSHFLTTRYRP